MTVSGKLVDQIPVKDGNKIYEIFRYRPNEISTVSPVIHGVDLHSGEWGNNGSVICWNYTHDGNKKTTAEKIAVDEAKMSMNYKVVEGDLMEQYNAFLSTLEVDTNGETNMVTWTVEYEKRNPNTPDPTTFMQLLLEITKDVDEKYNLQCN